MAYFLILGLGLALGEALTRMRDGGDCKWTTFGAWIELRAFWAADIELAVLAELLSISPRVI